MPHVRGRCTRATILMLCVVAILGAPGHLAAEELPAAALWSERTLQRDQPRINRLFRWGDRLLVQADAFYELNVASARVERLRLPGDPHVMDLAPIDRSRAVILSRDARGLYLVVGDLSSVTRRELPEAIRHSFGRARVFGSPGALGVWGGDKLYIERDARRRFRTLELPYRFGEPTASDPLLVSGSRLLVGYDRGEWGGALFAVDLETAHAEALNVTFPLKDLRLDGLGRLWVAGGVEHLAVREGYLWRLEGNTWTTLLEMHSLRKPEVSPGTGWSYGPAVLSAVAFDQAGVPHVLTEQFGVVRYEGGVWTQTTTFWPTEGRTPVRGLEITSDSTIVIATWDAGILLWKRGERQVRRVTLGP